MTRRTIGHLAAAMVLAATPAHAGGPLGYLKVGSWEGAAYTSDQTGALTHCAAASPHNGKIFVTLRFDVAGRWGLGFYHPGWRLAKQEIVPVVLTFDGRKQLGVQGMAVQGSERSMIISFPTESEILTHLPSSTRVTVTAKGRSDVFDLDAVP